MAAPSPRGRVLDDVAAGAAGDRPRDASTSSAMVTMRTTASGCRDSSRRVASTPPMPGIRTSISTSDGRSTGQRASTSSPEAASTTRVTPGTVDEHPVQGLPHERRVVADEHRGHGCPFRPSPARDVPAAARPRSGPTGKMSSAGRVNLRKPPVGRMARDRPAAGPGGSESRRSRPAASTASPRVPADRAGPAAAGRAQPGPPSTSRGAGRCARAAARGPRRPATGIRA